MTPQVDYSDVGIISDKQKWTKLSKTFVADAAYTNLIVGCFKKEESLLIQQVGNGSKSSDYVYYYIGSVGMPDSATSTVDTVSFVSENLFPTAFTPNTDGLNDKFRINTGVGYNLKDYQLRIFNRFGQLVFFTNEVEEGWDGDFNKMPQGIGTYFYWSIFKYNGEYRTIKGDFTLVR